MRRAFGWGALKIRTSQHFRRTLPKRSFCSSEKPSSSNSVINNGKGAEGSSLSKFDAYRELENLNFMTAAKILFSEPKNKKEFGLDFHLVQLFFVCMPSLAVYLVAQYARYEMRRMDAELELKKQDEEAKRKEMELKDTEEKEAKSQSNLLEVKTRLDKLEETIKEIVVKSEKKSEETTIKNQEEDCSYKKLPQTTGQGNTLNGAEGNDSVVESQDNNSNKTSNRGTTNSVEAVMSKSVSVSNATHQKDQKG